MALGDFVKKIYVKITVDGAEEAKRQLEEVKLEADRLKDGVKIPVSVDKDGMGALKDLRTELSRLRDPKVSSDLRDLAARFHALAASTDDARVRTRALAGELDALGKSTSSGWLGKMITGFSSSGGWQQALSSPAVWIAALAALPFIAQAAAGAIIFGLGGALTGIGILAARGVRSVRYQFSQLSVETAADFAKLGTAFGPALTTILSAARTFVPQFIASFRPALQAIAGPLASLGVMIAGNLASPQVAGSLRAVGQAFGGILKALTPMVPGMFTAISDGFTNIARAVAKNPKPIADLIAGLAHLIGILLDVIAWLTQVASYLEQHFIPAWHRTQDFLASWRHAIAANFEGFYHDTLSIFNRVKTDVANIWSSAWNNTVGVTIRGIRGVISQVERVPGEINSALAGLPAALFHAGAAAMDGLISGIQSKVGSIISTVSNIAGWIKAHFPFSPAKVGPLSGSGDPFYAGRAIVRQLAAGMDANRSLLTAAVMRLAHGAIPLPMIRQWTPPWIQVPNPVTPVPWIPAPGPGGGGTGIQVVLSAAPGADGALVRALWPWLRAEVRVRGGAGPQSVQRALGVVWR